MTTPQQPDRNAALDAAEGLTRALKGMEERLGEAIAQGDADSKARDAALARDGRHNRILIVVAMISLVLDVAATSVAVIALSAESRNAATVAQVHQSNLDGCSYNNVRLANQAKALGQILAAAAAPASAPAAQREASDRFEAKANAAISLGWAPRNCKVAYKLP